MASSDDILPSPMEEYNEETLRIFDEAWKFTEEDMKFQFTDEQLKEICFKHKCRVMASRWNMVYEYNLWLTKEGRFEGRSEGYKRGLLLKGVNRHKARLSYSEETIRKDLEEDWRIRKKNCILSLAMWERQRKQQQQEEQQSDPQNEEADQSDQTSVISHMDVTESQPLSGNVSEANPTVNDTETTHTESQENLLAANESCEISDTNETESQSLFANVPEANPTLNETDIMYTEFENMTEITGMNENECQSSTSMPSDPKTTTEIIHTNSQPPLNNEICELFNIDTESVLNLEDDSEVSQINTEDFLNEIPTTSTQKYSEENI